MIKSLKQARKLAREQEIALYGKTICYTMITTNKKKYNRNLTEVFEFLENSMS